MKRILSLLLLVCLLAGCSSQSIYLPSASTTPSGNSSQTQTGQPGTVQLSCNMEGSFHPYKATDLNNRSLLSLLYQGLFSVDGDYYVCPVLCKNYKVSHDMRTWTFYLENATFSSGERVTAEDVVTSLRSAKKDGFYAGRFLHITGIDASADGGIVITLDTPMNNLPLLLDIPIVKADQVNDAIPMGTGPYMLEETAEGKQLRRQAGWWCNTGLPVTAQIIPLVHGTTQQELWDLYKFSGLSMVYTDAYVDFRGDYELWESENGIFLYLSCNMKSKVFSNAAVRSALTHAIDRETLVQKYYRGFAHSATLPASPSFPYYSVTLAEKYGYQPEKFAQAVTENNLTGAAVTLLVNRDDPQRLRVAQAIAQMLTDAGLVVTIPEKSGTDYENALSWGQFDLVLGQTKLSPNMDLSAFFAQNGSLNYGQLTDVAAYAICLEALADGGNYQSLHKMVMDDGRLCPILMRSDAVYGRKGCFPGLSPARDQIFYYSLGKTMLDAKITE